MSGSRVLPAALCLAVAFATATARSDTVYKQDTDRSDTVYTPEDYYMTGKKSSAAPPPTVGFTRKCYQCSYTPPRITYVEKEVELRVHDTQNGGIKILRQKKLMPEENVGGWDKCAGEFTSSQAQLYSIADWACEHNCFVRVDKAGNLFRGCYRGEFGVDPYNVNDIQQVGNSQYKFCEEPLCNYYDMYFK